LEGDTLCRYDWHPWRRSLNYDSLPHSDKLHVVERFTETTPGKLTDEITIEDPDAFVAPWKELKLTATGLT